MLPLNPRTHGVFLLILVLLHQAHLQPTPAAEEENVRKIEGVKAAQKLKNIKKVKSILRIDADLAKNMKDEINGVKKTDADYEEENIVGRSEKESRVMVDSSLIDQVERLKKMFNVESLDQIASASPLDKTAALDLDDDDADDDDEDDDEDDDGEWKDETLARVNKDIRYIESQLSKTLKSLYVEKKKAEEDQKVAETLHKMLKENLNKVKKIKETFDEYKYKLETDDENIRELETMIKDLEMKKISDLEMLEQFADNQKSRALYSISQKGSLSESNRETDSIERELKSLTENSLFSSQERSSPNIDTIDTNAHNIFPVKKIISMKKVKSLTKLTEDQANRLKEAQEERNQEVEGVEGRTAEEVTNDEENAENPVPEGPANVPGGVKNDSNDYVVTGNRRFRRKG